MKENNEMKLSQLNEEEKEEQMTFRLESIANFQMRFFLALKSNTRQRQQLFEWITNSCLRCPAVPEQRVVI